MNSRNGNTTYTRKTVNFKHRMNNHIIACCYSTSTKKFDNYVFKCSNKNEHVARELYIKFIILTVDNENKLLYHESYLHKIRFDTTKC